MLHMRPYQPEDAEHILSWIKNEYAFRQWSADRYERYPAMPEDMNRLYAGAKDFFPMTAYDESGVVGHMTMRFPTQEKNELRFGFVIVDDTKRGCGYGKDMLNMALFYAFCVARVDRVSLAVFENNQAAYGCYSSAGFREVETEETEAYHVMGETWNCREMKLEQDEWRKLLWSSSK